MESAIICFCQYRNLFIILIITLVLCLLYLYLYSITVITIHIKDKFIISINHFIIANTKKYLQSDWLKGVQYWSYLYSVFNICNL